MIDRIKHLVRYNSELLDFSDKDVERMRRSRDLLLACTDEVVSVVYDRLFEVTETRKVFANGERAIREQTMRDWYSKTVSMDIDDRYWLWQWLIGALHVKRGVQNPMMISMMTLIQGIVLKRMMQTLGAEEGTELQLSFCKLTNLVVCLITMSYEESGFLAIQNSVGLSRELIHTDIMVGLDELIQDITKELER